MDNLKLSDEFYSFVCGSQDPLMGAILVSRVIDETARESWIKDELGRLASGVEAKDADAKGLSLYLRDLGFGVVRVRHYGQTARVEIPMDDFERFEHVRLEAEQIILASGYKVMELDPKGFRSGALNDVLNLSV